MITKVKDIINNLELGTVVLGLSFTCYFLGIVFILDRALLMLGNVFKLFYIKLLFIVGMIVLVGFQESLAFFARKIKGSISFFCGMFLIVINFKFIGILFQFYGIYEFFKLKKY